MHSAVKQNEDELKPTGIQTIPSAHNAFSLFQREMISHMIDADLPMKSHHSPLRSLLSETTKTVHPMQVPICSHSLSMLRSMEENYDIQQAVVSSSMALPQKEDDDNLILFSTPFKGRAHSSIIEGIYSQYLSNLAPIPVESLTISLVTTPPFDYSIHLPQPPHSLTVPSNPSVSLDYICKPLSVPSFSLFHAASEPCALHPLPLPSLPSTTSALHEHTASQHTRLTHYTAFLHCHAYLPLPVVLTHPSL